MMSNNTKDLDGALQALIETRIQEYMNTFKAEIAEQINENKRTSNDEVETKASSTQKTDANLPNGNGYKLKTLTPENLTNELSQGQAEGFQRYIKQEVEKSELRTHKYLADLREENKVLIEKVTRLEQGMSKSKEHKPSHKSNKSFSLKEKLPKGPLLFNDDSMNGSIDVGNDEEDEHKRNGEILELKQRLDDCENRVTETLFHVDDKLRNISSAIVNGINNRFSELLNSKGLVPQEQSQNRFFDVSDFKGLSEGLAESLNDVHHENNYEYQAKTEAEKTKKSRFAEDVNKTVGYINSNDHHTQDADSQNFIRDTKYRSVVIPERTMESNNEEYEQDRGQRSPRGKCLSQFSTREPHVGFRIEANLQTITDDIALIWRTINSLIDNTQDQFTKLRFLSASSPDNFRRSATSVHDGMSIADLRTEDSPQIRDDENGELRSPRRAKKIGNDRDIKMIIKEVKDDVHNQIVGVQREFDGELTGLRDTLLGYYTAFSEKIKLDNDELRNYIDERIEAIMNEIQNAFRGEENNNDLASANRSIIDYKVFKKMVQSDAFHLDVDVLEDGTHIDYLDKTIADMQKKQIQNVSEELLKSVWETIGMMANRLDQIERGGDVRERLNTRLTVK